MNATMDTKGTEQFRSLVTARFGLKFDDGKLAFLDELMQRRARVHNVPAAAYLNQIDDTEAALLAEELTVGETYFFRNYDQFRALREIVLPDRMQARGPLTRLNLLSAACSSGEEPFTLAMLMASHVPSPPWNISIRAVDLNPAALRKAAAGRYSPWALRETPPDMQQSWFTPDGKDMRIDPRISNAVQFDRRNLTDANADIWRPQFYDAIFCRNVIMYFTIPMQQAVIASISRSLAPGGYLFLGHAETLRGLSQDFHLRHTHDTFYYQRRQDGEPSTFQVPLPESFYAASPNARPPIDVPLDTSWFDSIGDATRRIEALMQAPAPEASGAPITKSHGARPAPQPNLSSALDLLQRERFSEALDQIAGMPEIEAAEPDVLLLRASLLVQSGRIAAAAEVCRLLLSRDELSAGANYVLALCFEASNDSASALLHYDVAAHLDAQFAMPVLHRGMLARRSRHYDDARADLTQALELLNFEDASRLLLFGGGFTRSALIRLCQSELTALGGTA